MGSPTLPTRLSNYITRCNVSPTILSNHMNPHQKVSNWNVCFNLRSTVSQGRLRSLESQLARKLDFKDLINGFASRKARRWALGESG